MNEYQKQIQEKCIDFAVRVDALRKDLNKKHREYNKANIAAAILMTNYTKVLLQKQTNLSALLPLQFSR